MLHSQISVSSAFLMAANTAEVSMVKLTSPQSLAITAAAVNQIKTNQKFSIYIKVQPRIAAARMYPDSWHIILNYPINQCFLLIYRVVFLFAPYLLMGKRDVSLPSINF
ncbi:hypothetical protein CHH92_01025 [Bacillus sonorensis]|uniref:Uncharacterized protein n=3 Tax=Bacillus sonorensis TaxID=119858 RepID=M5P9A7_9BACI|nr:hypothetical protein BSONL12_03559 [Bacillus sonorensis L12]PAD62078.1 hypothetical protein CHH92_01025 [Bacillus sonorensis]RHJ13686.1 hypothetical protein DW143_03555 [Bacillus sonorensis]GIN65896.1 hypothetical protein J41TS2_13170 [Bacillus sonorensis]